MKLLLVLSSCINTGYCIDVFFGLPRRGLGCCSKDDVMVSLILQGAASGSPAEDTRRKGGS